MSLEINSSFKLKDLKKYARFDQINGVVYLAYVSWQHLIYIYKYNIYIYMFRMYVLFMKYHLVTIVHVPPMLEKQSRARAG